jgi:glucosamine--fructose-6-phosphate aminotransferase (isomerizing)
MSALEETIRSQPELLRRALQLDLGDAEEVLGRARRIWLVGTGTSQHAAELGAALLADAGHDARWSSSAAFARWSPPPRPGDAVVVISHTGETAYAQTARDLAKEAGADVLNITGEGADWPDALEVAPRERSETYTASYTAVLLVLARLAHLLGLSGLGDQLGELPDRVGEALNDRALDGIEPPARLIALTGAGPAAVTAREGALKLREAARLPAEGFEAEYLLHGSAVPLGPDDMVLLVQPDADEDGLVRAVGDAAGAVVGDAAGAVVATLTEEPGLHPVLAQLPLTVRLQLLASRFADLRGENPDTVITGAWADERLWELGRPG